MVLGRTRYPAVVTCCVLCLTCVASAHGAGYVADETIVLPWRLARIEQLTTALDELNWRSSFGECDGFHLLNRPPWPLARVLFTKSVSLHAKFNGNIFESDVFLVDGQPVPSVIGPIFPDDPALRDLFLEQGRTNALHGVPSLPLEDPWETPEELVIWGRDESNFPKALKILRNAAAGGTAVFPRDFYREVDQLPLDGPETIFEFRNAPKSRYDFSVLGLSDGPETYLVPFRWVLGVSVRRAVISGCPGLLGAPRLTRVDFVPDPSEPLCEEECSSWFLRDSDPPVPGDEGEMCFDVDSFTSLDQTLLPVGGTGALKIVLAAIAQYLGLNLPIAEFDPGQEAFPEVIRADFDTGPQSLFRGYMGARCLMNRGFRLLDTVNPPGGPSIKDVRPLTHGNDYATDYDGVPIEMGFQLRYVSAPGLRGAELLNAAGAFNVLELLPVPALVGDYRHLVRGARFYVLGPHGRRPVTLPQLFQLIAWQWSKAPAYEPPRDLLVDHPRVDLGQLGPLTFEMRARLLVSSASRARYVSFRAIVSVHPGLYWTNVYGGDPLHE